MRMPCLLSLRTLQCPFHSLSLSLSLDTAVVCYVSVRVLRIRSDASIFSGIFSAYLLEHTILLLVTSLVGAYLLSTVIIGFVALIGGSQAADPGIFFVVLIALCILGLFLPVQLVRSYLNPSVSNEHQMGRYAAKEEGPDEAQLDLPPAEAGIGSAAGKRGGVKRRER